MMIDKNFSKFLSFPSTISSWWTFSCPSEMQHTEVWKKILANFIYIVLHCVFSV